MIGIFFQIIHVTGHHGPGFFQDLLISVPAVKQPGKDHTRTAPFRGIAESIPEIDIFRGDRRDQSLRGLGIHHTVNQFPVQVIDLIVEVDPIAHQEGLFHPSQFLTVWTIRHHTLQVTPDRPINERKDPVEQLIGAFKASVLRF